MEMQRCQVWTSPLRVHRRMSTGSGRLRINDGRCVLRLLEHLAGAGGECRRRVQAGDDFDAVERKMHNDAFGAKLWIWGWVGKDKEIRWVEQDWAGQLDYIETIFRGVILLMPSLPPLIV